MVLTYAAVDTESTDSSATYDNYEHKVVKQLKLSL